MKSEKEFLDGVYAKYEKELELRRKRTKMLSMCATLSACACVAIIVAIRSVPDINNVAEDAALADAAYGYTTQNMYSSSKEPSEEAVLEMAKSYKAAAKAQITADYAADIAEDGMLVSEVAEAEEAVAEADEDNGTLYSNAGKFTFNLYTSNSQTVYEDKIEYTDEDGSLIATAYLNDLRGFSCIGCTYPQVSEANGGYYINHNMNGESIVIFLSGEQYEKELAQSVADSIVYNED